jgi:hypothetical protein
VKEILDGSIIHSRITDLSWIEMSKVQDMLRMADHTCYLIYGIGCPYNSEELRDRLRGSRYRVENHQLVS